MDRNDAIISNWLTDIYEQQETQTEDVDFLLSSVGSKVKRVLEVACGSGRILVPFAKAGHQVTGIDIDDGMLSKISNKSEGLSNINWKKADILSSEWGTDYEVVVIAGNLLFNIITDMDYTKAQELLLLKASKALATGGMLYIDYNYTLHPERWFNTSANRVIFEGKDNYGNTGKMSVFNSTYCGDSGIVKSIRKFKITASNGDIIEKEIESVKHFATLEQIHTWLTNAGFMLENEYGDYNRNPISDRTHRALIVARKL